jgi:hypothetical protein
MGYKILMKKIFLALTLSIITTITCHAQLIHTNDLVKIALPNDAYKLTKQQVNALPGRPKFPSTSKIDYTPPYNYKIGNILLNLFNVNQDSINNDLPRKKRFEDDGHVFLRQNNINNNTYTSMIKSIGNKQALIINYSYSNKGRYIFYIQNEAKTLTQAGRMEYPETDAAKAEALLNEIINSIQFTK